MTRVPLIVSVVLAQAAFAQAADKPAVVKLEAPPRAEWVTVQADPVLTTLSAGVPAKWVLVDDGPTADLRASADGKSAAFAATADGHYRVLVIAGEDVFRVKVVKASKPPEPMPPGPDVKPADPLAVAIQAAYTAEPNKDKAEAMKLKIEMYGQIATLVAGPDVATTGGLLELVRKAGGTLDQERVPGVRKLLRAELQAAFPEDVPLTAETRAKAVALFNRIKTCLEQVK